LNLEAMILANKTLSRLAVMNRVRQPSTLRTLLYHFRSVESRSEEKAVIMRAHHPVVMAARSTLAIGLCSKQAQQV
jgi:hypothetical protein